jgi:phosphoribosylformimino-5-aminoimidazole carboxamide ribotide isomerase
MTMFEIIPAIDLRAGRCVRLSQGDFERETVFGEDPVAIGRHWQRLGAVRLHAVDLDGARAGRPVQLALANEIARSVHVPVQLGGGLRRPEDVEAALACGVERVVVGTAAIGAPDDTQALEFRRACLVLQPERIIVGLDARDGKLAVRGWTENTGQDVLTFAARLRDEGFRRVIYTDISRDGVLGGPNLDHLERLAAIDGLAVIASGGISGLADLEAVAAIGVEGAIVGQALYTGDLSLTDAIGQLAAFTAGV